MHDVGYVGRFFGEKDLPMAFCNGYKSPKSLKHRKSLEFPYDLTIMVYCGIMVTY